MEYLSRKTREIFAKIYPAAEKEQVEIYSRELTKYERYLQIIGKILSWEDVSLTLTVFLILNFIFWFVVQYEFRIFGAVFFLFLIGFIADMYLESYELAKDDLYDYFYDLRVDFYELVVSLRNLRRESHSFFFIGTTFFFIVMSFVARNISGYNLSYIGLLTIFFVPLIIMSLPSNIRSNCQRLFGHLASENGVLAEDELIPFLTDKDFGEKETDLESLLTDRTADSVTNSLVSGIMSMPSHLDGDDLTLDEDDLLPVQKCDLVTSGGVTVTPGDLSSDSDSEHKGIHFSGNLSTSSSEDDEVFAKKFQNFDESDGTTEMSTGGRILGNLLNVGSNLMANVIKKGVESTTIRKSSSSDSDFEIINYEEQ